jgi:hypothetical protein
MKTLCQHLPLLAAIALLSLPFTACERSANVESDLQKITQQINPPSSKEDKTNPKDEAFDQDRYDDTSMQLPTAQLIVRADAVLTKLGRTAAAPTKISSDASSRLINTAKAVLQRNGGVLTQSSQI